MLDSVLYNENLAEIMAVMSSLRFDKISKASSEFDTVRLTMIPRMPPYVKGVINLRGKVIPVIDLRLKFAMEEAAYTERTYIIILPSAMEVCI
jgi:purine-binding chemotaxis protein CheW